jgi:phosphoribosylformimino-5-aminoimidazole carboxamide ribotide isomerase
VSTYSDLEELEKTGCSGVIVGKAIYEERITMQQLKEYIN